MDFVSIQFVIAVIVCTIVYYSLGNRYKNGFLILLSCLFIGSLDYLLLPYVIIYALFNYYIGIKLAATSKKKLVFRIGIWINLLQLGLLKYASFTFDPMLDVLDTSIRFSKISEFIVPFGISYITLQGIGYLINIQKGWEKPESYFPNLLLYFTFFPKFLSGPIERSNHFIPQIKKWGSLNEANIISGARIILYGFFKKVAIANQLAPYVLSNNMEFNSSDGFSLWTIFLVQPLYLYFDFSGYTDIAIGFAKMFGIDLLPNFNRPFFSQNMTNFWKRFHISLSSWFNDYIFKQTMFKRRKWGEFAPVYALIITWVLFGIWHGAGWTFMLLGFLQAIAIIYEYFTRKWRKKLFSSMGQPVSKMIGRIATYLFYCISMVFFFSPSLGTIALFMKGLFTKSMSVSLDGISTIPYMLLIYIPIIFFVELLQEDYPNQYNKIERNWYRNSKRNQFLRWTLYSLIITILIIVGFEEQQFVYVDF
ncbi:MBOAT family O-acyltransferase [Saccharicrinis sp. 156]|uniref:MBOAT family O-acyltransferase n=1 Tax=Saccharicrinis sp. 156 TaxID=3417574 RepID=UPI003D32DC79